MATVTPVLDTRRTTKDGLYPISIRVTAGNKSRSKAVGYRVKKTQWDGHQVINHSLSNLINGVIASKINQARKYIADCEINGAPLHLDLVGTSQTSPNFIDYLAARAKHYLGKEQIIMARKVTQLKKELIETFGEVLSFSMLNGERLRQYEIKLIEKANGNTTRHKKFKLLRQFYKQAIDEGKASGVNPFLGYKIPLDPVNKEKLTPGEVNAMEQLELNKGPVNDARNLWLFSYYCKGARFENCVTMLRKSITGGRILFQSNKGRKFISVKIHPKLKALLALYPKGKIIFPFLPDIPETAAAYLRAVDSQNVVVNRNLKTVAALAGINKRLTFHTARHTLAYHLLQQDSSIHVIKEALGHSKIATTEIYLKSLGDERVDEDMKRLYGG